MPALIGSTAGAVKRKSSDTKQKAVKRARSESSHEDNAQVRIFLLENEILESKKHYNNISKLINLLTNQNSNSKSSILASIALCRIFMRLMASGDLTRDQDTREKDAVVILWLQERYSEYKKVLLDIIVHSESSSTALTLCMRMLKSEGTHLRGGKDYNFPIGFFSELVEALLNPETDENLRREFSEKFIEEYDDVRFYTFSVIEKFLNATATQESVIATESALEILAAVESVPESKEELEDFYIPAPTSSKHALHSLTAHKKNAQGAWLALMRLPMDKNRRKIILGLMGKYIAPWFVKPELLMDFLTDSYDAGGSMSLLALDGVFYLIQEKNLDYPSFYRKLYSLMDAGLLHSKHRSKFFRLLDTFLASTHLPAVLVASFIKRLARLTLFAPPAGIVAVVPWIYNLLKKHPTCTFMIHRIWDEEVKEILEKEGMDDPFNQKEDDPMDTNAIESSLWEIVMLQSHYHPNVATLAKIISEQFTKHAYNLEDFLDHSYGSMLEAELSKEVKKTPVVEFEIPKRILFDHDEKSDSMLVKLWDFS